MPGKITLITPPDFFENGNKSILFAHIDEQEQDVISKWLADNNLAENMNFYVYSGEPNPSWFLYATNRCEYKYINIDCVNYITQALSGHILSKTDTYYKSSDANLASVYSHINGNRVEQVEQFLESVLGGNQTNNNTQL